MLQSLLLKTYTGDDKLDTPSNWGQLPSHQADLVTNMNFFVSYLYKKEKVAIFKKKLNKVTIFLVKMGPVVPGSGHLVPTRETINSHNFKHGFFLLQVRSNLMI